MIWGYHYFRKHPYAARKNGQWRWPFFWMPWPSPRPPSRERPCPRHRKVLYLVPKQRPGSTKKKTGNPTKMKHEPGKSLKIIICLHSEINCSLWMRARKKATPFSLNKKMTKSEAFLSPGLGVVIETWRISKRLRFCLWHSTGGDGQTGGRWWWCVVFWLVRLPGIGWTPGWICRWILILKLFNWYICFL